MKPQVRRTHLATAAVYLAIAAVTAAHYSTGEHAHQLHDIYRRLYYVPIILAAFLHGFRGGLIAAAVICIVYAPHATGHISHDPASTTQKWLEMLLYLMIGTLTGALVSRLKGAQRQVENAATELAASLAQLRETVAQLRSTEDQLVRTARLAAVGRLSAGLAHEIRNPLASIQGSAEILADDFPVAHPKRRLLNVLLDESQRLNEVLTRFLSFARPRELKAAAFAIEPEIRTVIELARTQKETARARIEVMDHPCPDGSGSGNGPARADDSNAGTAAVTENPLLAFGDREQIRQVLLNLILNAAQAAGPGGHVEVRCSAEEDRIRLEIRDDGPGFSDEAIENVFTPFFTTKEKGTGLGLAISHRIVESHGGCIEVANRPEGGACVTLELPRPDRPARNEGAHHG